MIRINKINKVSKITGKNMIDEHFDIELSINKIIEDLKRIPHHITSVFFMGDSGSGKGTLINYLIRNPHLKAETSPTG